MKGSKTMNEYARRITPRIFEDTPKAVFAALCVSYLDRLGVSPDNIDKEIANEWATLNANGITQKLPASVRALVDAEYLEDVRP